MPKILPTLVLSLLIFNSSRADDTTPLVFNLASADISKAVVLMYKGSPSSTLLEVTFNKEKQAELAALATSSGGTKPIQVVLNGKPVADHPFAPGSTGHSVKISCASPKEAFATAQLLLATAPPADASTNSVSATAPPGGK